MGSQTDTQQTGVAGAGPLTTGANDVNTGTYYVSESGGLTDYSSSLACTKNGDAYVPGANDSVVVGKGDTVVCTFTNTRDQGSIKVIKDFVGAPADAKVNLQIDGVTKKANALDNDTTGFIPVDTGTHSVGETQVTGTNLSDYTSSIVCKLGTTTVASGDGTSLGDIPVGKGDQVVCTITNTRITGSFKITKVLNPGGSGFNINTLFTINYTCKIGTTTTASGSVQLKGGQSQTINGIPTGSVCTVTEPTQPGAPTGYSWWVTISPTSVTITKDANPIPRSPSRTRCGGPR